MGLFVGCALFEFEVMLRSDLGTAQNSCEPGFHLVLGEEFLRLCGERLVKVCIAVQHELRRFHQELSGRLAGVQGDEFELCQLFKVQIYVHLINAIFR